MLPNTQAQNFEPISFLKSISAPFVGREEEAKVITLALLTKEHAVLIGEPGTAKSALIIHTAKLLNARYFYYLLNKFTTPDEIVGSIDPIKFKNGEFVRNRKGKLSDVEIAFLDEIFKANSEVLNVLLNIINERLFVDVDSTVYKVPLWSLFGASNETPTSDELNALYDRFLLRHFVTPLSSNDIITAIKLVNANNDYMKVKKFSLSQLSEYYEGVTKFMIENINEIANAIGAFVSKAREHNITISDRTAISKLPRLVATYSMMYSVPPKRSIIAVAKYLVREKDQLDEINKIIASMYPKELGSADEKIQQAYNEVQNGNLSNALALLDTAMQTLLSLTSNANFTNYLDDINQLLTEAENLKRLIVSELEKFKKIKK